MSDIRINSFLEFHNVLTDYVGGKVIFRGARDAVNHKLITRLGRGFSDIHRLMSFEHTIFEQFRLRSLPYLELTPSNEWEWLALAQHHGLPTRLLDWTFNPLTALFFAVEKIFDGDSAVYIYKNPPQDMDTTTEHPFKIDRMGRFTPPHITRRIAAQAGLFTIHPTPILELRDAGISKITISKDARKQTKDILQGYGINRASLFPDLDGIAAHITWLAGVNDN